MGVGDEIYEVTLGAQDFTDMITILTNGRPHGLSKESQAAAEARGIEIVEQRRIGDGATDRYRDRWRSLPPKLRTDQQLAGVGAVACGATHSVMERCNFACTSCYLSAVANATEPAPFDEVRDVCFSCSWGACVTSFREANGRGDGRVTCGTVRL